MRAWAPGTATCDTGIPCGRPLESQLRHFWSSSALKLLGRQCRMAQCRGPCSPECWPHCCVPPCRRGLCAAGRIVLKRRGSRAAPACAQESRKGLPLLPTVRVHRGACRRTRLVQPRASPKPTLPLVPAHWADSWRRDPPRDPGGRERACVGSRVPVPWRAAVSPSDNRGFPSAPPASRSASGSLPTAALCWGFAFGVLSARP